jgi:hypothetical protein
MNFTRNELAKACREWGGYLWLPPEINGRWLLWAMAGCESSFGADCGPRHEPAYDVGGKYADNPAMAALLEKYGRAAACSYGPWQILLVNCGTKTAPQDMTNLDQCAVETVSFINRRILAEQKPSTVEEIAEAWNSGKWRWQTVPPGVERYAAECRRHYDAAATEMPAS